MPEEHEHSPVKVTDRLTLSQTGPGQGLVGTAKAQLSAHHGGRAEAPVVVADGPPLAILQHLHAALAHAGTSLQPHQGLLWGVETILGVRIESCGGGGGRHEQTGLLVLLFCPEWDQLHLTGRIPPQVLRSEVVHQERYHVPIGRPDRGLTCQAASAALAVTNKEAAGLKKKKR